MADTLLRNFRFRIQLSLSAPGGGTALADGAFQECTGLDIDLDVQEYYEGGCNDAVVRRVGRAKYQNIVLKRGLTQDAELWTWHKQVADGNVHRRNGSVILLDDHGQEQVRWNFYNSWPCKYVGPTLNAKSNDVAIETLELVHEGFERV